MNVHQELAKWKKRYQSLETQSKQRDEALKLERDRFRDELAQKRARVNELEDEIDRLQCENSDLRSKLAIIAVSSEEEVQPRDVIDEMEVEVVDTAPRSTSLLDARSTVTDVREEDLMPTEFAETEIDYSEEKMIRGPPAVGATSGRMGQADLRSEEYLILSSNSYSTPIIVDPGQLPTHAMKPASAKSKKRQSEYSGSSGMKWESFVKIMGDLGFEYDVSTPGTAVRFDPPNPNDRSITFHKPHPDNMIHPIMLKEFSKRIQKYYGWTLEERMEKLQIRQ